MLHQRPRVYPNSGPLYLIDIVETEGGLGYFSRTPPVVRVIERDPCPKCGNNEEWVFTLETGDGVCPCGHTWNTRDE